MSRLPLLLLAAVAGAPSAPVDWTALTPARASANSGATLAPQADGSLLVSGPATATDVYTLEFESLPKGVTGFRLDALPDPSLPASGPGRADNGNFALSELRVTVGSKGSKRPRAVALQNATADFAQNGFPAAMAIDGVPTTGWAIDPKFGTPHHLVVETRSDLQLESGVLTIELEFAQIPKHSIGRFKLSATTSPRPVRADVPADAVGWGEVQSRINDAIDHGCDWLVTQQLLDGSWDADQVNYRNGGTALVTYALLKSGVPKTHPAIARSLEYMRCNNPRETYTLGCQILALHSLNDPSVDPWIKQLGEQLVQFQQPNGGFSYGFQGGIDLSNSQYGALGLRTAALHGMRVAPEVWEKLAGFVTGQSEDGGGGAYAPMGFFYAPNAKPTGSMTAAGVGVLAICAEQLKGRNTKFGNLIGLARRGGDWLGQHFLVDSNPRSDGQWLYYYLYGVERVGALLDTEELGSHRWYREGARWLVDHQDTDGKWSFAGNSQLCNTSWALLFLTRATSVASGKTTRSLKLYGGDDPRAAVSIRASGDTPLTFWISSFGEAELSSYEWPNEAGRGVRVKQVEWFASGGPLAADTPISRIDKDGQQPSGRERFGGQYSFGMPGKYTLFARAHLLGPPDQPGGPASDVVLESPKLEVKIDEASDADLLSYARDASRNLLLNQRLTVTASSTINEWWDVKYLANGLLSRGWASADKDPKPKLTIELEKPVRANVLLVTNAKVSDDRPSRITKLLVTFNGKAPPLELTMDPSPLRKSRLKLAQPIVVRRIDLEVAEVTAADAPMASVGIAELELQIESGGKK
jgi:hypothetical protein